MQNTMSTKGMLEGALLAVITALLALAGAFIPMASILTFLITAVPIIVMIVRHNTSVGIASSLVAAFIIGLLAGPIYAVIFYIQFMILAIIYGYLFKQKKSAGKILAVGIFTASITIIVLILFTTFVSGISFTEQKQAIYETIDRSIQLYEDNGWMKYYEEQGIDREELKTMLYDFIELFFRVLPAILIIGSIFSALTHFLMARIVLKRLGYNIPKFPPFSHWHLPWYSVWGLIIGWGSFLLGDIYNNNLMIIFGQNIMIAYGSILFILGASVVYFYLRKYKFSRFSRVMLIILAVMMMQTTVMILFLVAIFDLVIDIRKLNKSKKPS